MIKLVLLLNQSFLTVKIQFFFLYGCVTQRGIVVNQYPARSELYNPTLAIFSLRASKHAHAI